MDVVSIKDFLQSEFEVSFEDINSNTLRIDDSLAVINISDEGVLRIDVPLYPEALIKDNHQLIEKVARINGLFSAQDMSCSYSMTDTNILCISEVIDAASLNSTDLLKDTLVAISKRKSKFKNFLVDFDKDVVLHKQETVTSQFNFA
ncbi:hypothetical protein [Vibrio marisflavi]|uniref:Uncharacterized protein n=1 Tax=Vibrio marisflavi CECT 7928 TaxID=634439 RepID=A0ABN8DXP1_9VIBR|nr:hypothetical protein [Vibrio marisflavi]CAH0536010.1 hypothetical protein VMF7928_00106 [Vibrio marisflavi CECT 7928]